MELINIQHHNNKLEETLIADFKEGNDILAQLFITKDNVDFKNNAFDFDDPEVLRQITISKQGPFSQVIAITTNSSKDTYVDSSKAIEREHKEIVNKVSNFIMNLTGISPTYTKSEDGPVETIKTYSARVITEVNLISKIVKYLKDNNVVIEELDLVIEEDLIKNNNMRRI